MAVNKKEGDMPTGAIGNVIPYKRGSKDCIRVKPVREKHKDAKSDKQLVCRNRFTVTQAFTQYISDFIKITYNSQKRGAGTALNAFTSHILLDALKGQSPNVTIDCEKLFVGRGELEAPKWATVTPKEDGYLIEWDTAVRDKNRLEDRLYYIDYNPNNAYPTGGIFEDKRGEGKMFLESKMDPSQPNLEFWIGFCTEDQTMCCDSVYVRRESVELARQHQKEQLLAQRRKDRKRKLSADVKAINPNLSIEISELINSEIQPPCDELNLELLAQQIQSLRNQKGITQEEFGILIGKSKSQVGRIESGKQNISISLLLQIMKALNARVVYRLETESQ